MISIKNELKKINVKKLEKLIETEKNVIVKFTMNGCYPCKKQSQIFLDNTDLLLKKYGIKIFELYVDSFKNSKIVVKFEIKSVPLIDFIHNGEHHLMKSGLKTIEEIEEFIRQFF